MKDGREYMRKTLICIGDSITEGVGSSNANIYSYVAQLGILLGSDYEVVNCGRNGATLMKPANGSDDQYKKQSQFNKAIETAKNAHKEGSQLIVSIMLGTNDGDIASYGFTERSEVYYNKYHDVFLDEMFFLINTFIQICPLTQFIIAKSPYSYDPVKHKNYGNLHSVWKFQEEAVIICREKNIPVLTCDMAFATSPEIIGKDKGVTVFYGDRLHPNDVGHMYFAHFFYEAVKSIIEYI
ncbi:MAG: hypothetical protein DBX47_06705 [Clostridiales bacterium]|nr:MAG: hypothetical protein DBX47_06705 [Clostridiales bacterium]